MTQLTAKNIVEALYWIQTEPHFEAGLEYKGDIPTHRFYRNHHNRLRIPIGAPWAVKFFALTRANPRPHDDRMFALTPKGKRFLESVAVWNHKEHP